MTSIEVKLQSSFYMPFYSLTHPAIDESFTQFKAEYFMITFHQVFKDTQIFLFVFVIEYVALYNMFCGMPFYNLPRFFFIMHDICDIGLFRLGLISINVKRTISGLHFLVPSFDTNFHTMISQCALS